MDFFSVLTLIGGIAFFLFGMSLMGNGLEKVSGGKMKIILEKMTNTPLKRVLLGAFVTAAIQSSSATTVMVVGFVNSGIMNLSQAIGIIMGANIGTTVTGWLLSLNSLEGSGMGLLVRIFQPSSFTPVLALAGIVMFKFMGRGRKRDIGSIFLGFAVLMSGMAQMSSSMSGLRDSAAFAELITAFSHPLLALAAGTVITAVIQSSSASIGIIQALSVTGAINMHMTIPLIIGTSIGASAPCLISAIGANKNAKRAAYTYLYFNLIGAIILLPLYLILDGIFHFGLENYAASAVDLALVNTVFNTLTTVLLVPFTRQFEKLMRFTIKDSRGASGAEAFELLDQRFLTVAPIAIEQAKRVVVKMAEIAKKAIEESLVEVIHFDKKKAELVAGYENETDEYEDRLGTYLVQVSRMSMTEAESNMVSNMLHSIGDLERIADHADNIVNLAREIAEKKLTFSEEAKTEIDAIMAALREIVTLAVDAFVKDDPVLASQVEPLEEVIDLMKAQLRSRHIRRLQNAECTIENGFVYNDLITNIERVSDHCSNIAVSVIQLKNVKMDAHEYLRDVKKNGDEFKRVYQMFKEKYYTPIKSL